MRPARRLSLRVLAAGMLAVAVTAGAAAAGAMPAFASGAARTGAVTVSPGSHAWGTAKEVPGTAVLNQGGNAQINSVSCASAGNCGAGGFYTDSSHHQQAFVVSEVNGTWGTAIEVPGTAALNRGGVADITSVSCASAGNCTAGGKYVGSSGFQAFVVSEVNGTWHTAIEVPGTAALNRGQRAAILSVSCGSAGNCSAGGYYTDNFGGQQALVATQASGVWHTAIEVPGTAALNQGTFAAISSVSCRSAGNCSAGGGYTDGFQLGQAMVVSETNGTWQNAEEVPSSAALNRGGTATINSVSCGSAGNCSAGGYYTDRFGVQQVMAASQAGGVWHTAIEVPGTAALNRGGLGAEIFSVSCASAGNCSAGGIYTDSSQHQQAFVASQAGGTWSTAIEVPGTAALNRGGQDGIGSVSCGSAGNCSAGGSYLDTPSSEQAFVVGQASGVWSTAIEVPGTAALNRGGAAIIGSVSCAAAGNCSAGGFYVDSSHHTQAFVDSET